MEHPLNPNTEQWQREMDDNIFIKKIQAYKENQKCPGNYLWIMHSKWKQMDGNQMLTFFGRGDNRSAERKPLGQKRELNHPTNGIEAKNEMRAMQVEGMFSPLHKPYSAIEKVRRWLQLVLASS